MRAIDNLSKLPLTLHIHNNHKENTMRTTIATAIEQQALNHYAASSLTANSFVIGIEVLNDIEIELEDILVKEFEQRLPIDLNPSW